MSASSRYGKLSRISARVAPSASMSSTSVTRIRMPRTVGLPKQTSGLTVIRGKTSVCMGVLCTVRHFSHRKFAAGLGVGCMEGKGGYAPSARAERADGAYRLAPFTLQSEATFATD